MFSPDHSPWRFLIHGGSATGRPAPERAADGSAADEAHEITLDPDLHEHDAAGVDAEAATAFAERTGEG